MPIDDATLAEWRRLAAAAAAFGLVPEGLDAKCREAVPALLAALDAERAALVATEAERDEANASAAALADRAKALDYSLGEYVRQTMHVNPEWREGIEAMSDAWLAERRRQHRRDAAGLAECERLRRGLVTWDKRAADALADEVAALVRRGVLDARSPAADALLDYRTPPSSPRADRLASLERECERLRALLAPDRGTLINRLASASAAVVDAQRAFDAATPHNAPRTRERLRAAEATRDEARAALAALEGGERE